MSINLIGVPINYGCDKEGTQYGPDKLRYNYIVDSLNKIGIEYKDLGDIDILKVESQEKYKSNPNIKYYDAIYDVSKNLERTVYESLTDNDFTVVLGGDHSLAIGSISGASRQAKNLGVVWLDAHGDFNTEEISISKNSHGMPLAILCGYGNENLVNLCEEKVKLKEKNVFHIGGRDFDIKEKELMDKTEINIYSKYKIDDSGFENIIDEVIENLSKENIDAIHMSIDIDFLDSDLVPGTGTRVSGGYSVEDMKYIIDRILRTGLVKSIDFVEFNPILDEDDKTLNICVEILEYIFIKYKELEHKN